MDLGIAGKAAAVAASSAGLGLGTAAALAAEGVEVVVCGRDEHKLRDAANSIGAIPLVCDVSSYDGGVEFVRRAAEALGRPVDILVANSGGPRRGSYDEMVVEDYASALQNNLLSSIGMCHAAVGPMRASGWGRIVAITSTMVKQPTPGMVLSATARAGLTAFMKALAHSVAGDGVTVNNVMPGFHLTARSTPDVRLATGSGPTGGDPADFGRAVAFLCSTSARYISGTSLLIDGGQSHALM